MILLVAGGKMDRLVLKAVESGAGVDEDASNVTSFSPLAEVVEHVV